MKITQETHDQVITIYGLLRANSDEQDTQYQVLTEKQTKAISDITDKFFQQLGE